MSNTLRQSTRWVILFIVLVLVVSGSVWFFQDRDPLSDSPPALVELETATAIVTSTFTPSVPTPLVTSDPVEAVPAPPLPQPAIVDTSCPIPSNR